MGDFGIAFDKAGEENEVTASGVLVHRGSIFFGKTRTKHTQMLGKATINLENTHNNQLRRQRQRQP